MFILDNNKNPRYSTCDQIKLILGINDRFIGSLERSLLKDLSNALLGYLRETGNYIRMIRRMVYGKISIYEKKKLYINGLEKKRTIIGSSNIEK